MRWLKFPIFDLLPVNSPEERVILDFSFLIRWSKALSGILRKQLCVCLFVCVYVCLCVWIKQNNIISIIVKSRPIKFFFKKTAEVHQIEEDNKKKKINLDSNELSLWFYNFKIVGHYWVSSKNIQYAHK